jgi:zinc protease
VVYNHDEHYSELNFKSGAQNYIRCNKLITDRLKFPSSFTFSLVGDFTVDSIIPYIIKYLASIPVSTIKGNTSESSYLPTANGTHRSDFLVASDGIPKSYQFKLLSGNLPYSLKNEIYLDFIEPIMKSVFFMQLRECGIENVNINSSASLSKFENKWSYSYTFSCADSLCSVIDSLAITAFKKLLQDGIDSATFNKVKSLVLMQYRYSLHDNSYWITMLRNRSLGIEKINGTAAILDNISVLDFNRFLKSLDYGGNVIDVTMKCGKRKGRGSL